MDTETSIAMCRSMAKAYSTGVRLFEKDFCVYYYSVSHIRPDPLGPYLHQILDSEEEAGIITTPLYQFYGFLTLPGGQRMILGPTRMLQEDTREFKLMLAMLGVAPQAQEEYLRLLRSSPIINADRFAWLLASLSTALWGRLFPVEKVWLQIRPESSQAAVQAGYAQQQLDTADDAHLRQSVQQSYAWEQLILSYVEDGQPELLRELFSAPPNISAGRIAHDALRQAKNTGICTATAVSRAAIGGGLDVQQAFSMSDLYIQKLELLRDISAVEQLIREMLLDFAGQVEKLHRPAGGESRFYRMCAQYVSENLFSTIRAQQMADALGYTRAYLCTRFKQEAGISLSRYIQQEKIAEARRLLRFTDQGLGEIAALLDFSSQSHFQTVFRNITGETPLAYRRRTRLTVN